VFIPTTSTAGLQEHYVVSVYELVTTANANSNNRLYRCEEKKELGKLRGDIVAIR
jgi:hypothetical protein